MPTSLRQHTPVLALPGFDEYLLGYRDRSHVISTADLVRVVPGRNGIFLPLVVTNGRIVGTWRKKIAISGVTADATLFEEAREAATRTRAEKTAREFDRAAQDYAGFLGVPYRLSAKRTLPASV
ncbi:DNA glycosylase AlkZ-like family protein [Cryobacterium glaciale]|uniref:DNA glycosylase AlkZ-like family protein n=1 Tax=Cryobacterium glaciale TaxID=1259145 RepID=UPI003B96EB7D